MKSEKEDSEAASKLIELGDIPLFLLNVFSDKQECSGHVKNKSEMLESLMT
jgi:hypothetical protein